jgi:hypothetical protein
MLVEEEALIQCVSGFSVRGRLVIPTMTTVMKQRGQASQASEQASQPASMNGME